MSDKGDQLNSLKTADLVAQLQTRSLDTAKEELRDVLNMLEMPVGEGRISTHHVQILIKMKYFTSCGMFFVENTSR